LKLYGFIGVLMLVAVSVNCAVPLTPVSPQPVVIEHPVVSPTTPPIVSAPVSSVTDGISWSEAINHVGETMKVCGTVAGAHWANTSKGKPSFLNVGKPYPDPARFIVIIWGSNREKFSQPPEKYYNGKTICVTGLITQYNGMPEVEVKAPDQITVR